jgi:hypothetical protein
MDIGRREIFETMTFSFSRDSSYVRNMTKLPAVERIATLRSAQTVFELFARKTHTPEATLHQLLVPLRAEAMDLMRVLERTYGDGHYAERSKSLDILLSDLEQHHHVDLAALLKVLREGHRRRALHLHGGREVDARRQLARHGRMVKDLRALLLKLKKSYGILLGLDGIGFVIVETLATVEASLNLTQKLDLLHSDLDHDPLAHATIPGPYRRSSIGKPTAPWRKFLRSELIRVGVPEEFEESLLISTGLLPYRPLPSDVL